MDAEEFVQQEVEESVLRDAEEFVQQEVEESVLREVEESVQQEVVLIHVMAQVVAKQRAVCLVRLPLLYR